MHSAVFATATCLSIRLSVTAGIVSSRAKAESRNVHHLIAPWFHFLANMTRRKIRKGWPPRNLTNERGWVFRRFSLYLRWFRQLAADSEADGIRESTETTRRGKKTSASYYHHFSLKCWPILITLSLLHSQMNCRKSWNNIYHFTSNLLSH